MKRVMKFLLIWIFWKQLYRISFKVDIATTTPLNCLVQSSVSNTKRQLSGQLLYNFINLSSIYVLFLLFPIYFKFHYLQLR